MEEEQLDLALQGLPAHGIRAGVIDGRGITNDHELLVRVAQGMDFPDYFGKNWDALDECLRDLDWLPAAGYVLAIRNSSELWIGAGLSAGQLIESWLFVAEHWQKENKPFHLVFLDMAPAVSPA